MAKRTRQRQLKKLAERRAYERRRRQRRKQILAGVVIVALVGSAAATAFALLRGGDAQPGAGPSPTPSPPAPADEVACGGERPAAADGPKPQFDRPPKLELEEGRDYRATIVTSCGTIELDLFEDETPVTVNNFVFLAGEGFYDGVTFHRVIEGFMIQSGDPEGTGTGGPGYEFEDEILESLTFDEPGLLAMANPGQPDTNGSQFFITVEPAPHLDPPRAGHTIFGKVTKGMDVVREINGLPVEGAQGSDPVQTIYIERVRIRTR